MNLTKLGQSYEQWDKDAGKAHSINDILMHITSELGEAFECVRKKEKDYWERTMPQGLPGKPEGLGPELADVVILVAKLAAYNNIDIEKMIELKHNYNLTRLP